MYVRAESLNSRLAACGWPSAFINGSQDQRDRLLAMSKLKKFKCRILISTDLVSLVGGVKWLLTAFTIERCTATTTAVCGMILC